jgi:hypothetical protein
MLKIEGWTIDALAAELGINANAVSQRIYVAKIKPIKKLAIYPPDTFDKIRNVPSRGRPPKNKAEK